MLGVIVETGSQEPVVDRVAPGSLNETSQMRIYPMRYGYTRNIGDGRITCSRTTARRLVRDSRTKHVIDIPGFHMRIIELMDGMRVYLMRDARYDSEGHFAGHANGESQCVETGSYL
jgi:hypothetical protein